MFIDMDDVESWLEDSSSHCIEPEIEGMVVIVEYYNLRSSYNSHKIPESLTRPQNSIFYLFKYHIISDYHIIESSIYETRDSESRGLSIQNLSFLPSKGIVPEMLCEDMFLRVGIRHFGVFL